jgi:hypothetical protein
MTDITLTDSQHQILVHAVQKTCGKLEWFPENLKGAAKTRVLDALLKRSLITRDGEGWCITTEGMTAIGEPEHTGMSFEKINQALAMGLENFAKHVSDNFDPESIRLEKPRTRANSKQVEVIAMLKRPEGATIDEICAVTGWQAHTVRGTFAGAFKKKLGLEITSVKEDGRGRVYRIA